MDSVEAPRVSLDFRSPCALLLVTLLLLTIGMPPPGGSAPAFQGVVAIEQERVPLTFVQDPYSNETTMASVNATDARPRGDVGPLPADIFVPTVSDVPDSRGSASGRSHNNWYTLGTIQGSSFGASGQYAVSGSNLHMARYSSNSASATATDSLGDTVAGCLTDLKLEIRAYGRGSFTYKWKTDSGWSSSKSATPDSTSSWGTLTLTPPSSSVNDYVYSQAFIQVLIEVPADYSWWSYDRFLYIDWGVFSVKYISSNPSAVTWTTSSGWSGSSGTWTSDTYSSSSDKTTATSRGNACPLYKYHYDVSSSSTPQSQGSNAYTSSLAPWPPVNTLALGFSATTTGPRMTSSGEQWLHVYVENWRELESATRTFHYRVDTDDPADVRLTGSVPSHFWRGTACVPYAAASDTHSGLTSSQEFRSYAGSSRIASWTISHSSYSGCATISESRLSTTSDWRLWTRASDQVGNQDSDQLSGFRVDVTSPTGSNGRWTCYATSPGVTIGAGQWTNCPQNQITFSANFNDPDARLYGWSSSVMAGTTPPTPSTNVAATWNGAPASGTASVTMSGRFSSDGYYAAGLRAADNTWNYAGSARLPNWAVHVGSYIGWDVTAPTCSAFTNDDGGAWARNSLTNLSIICTDGASGIDSVYVLALPNTSAAPSASSVLANGQVFSFSGQTQLSASLTLSNAGRASDNFTLYLMTEDRAGNPSSVSSANSSLLLDVDIPYAGSSQLRLVEVPGYNGSTWLNATNWTVIMQPLCGDTHSGLDMIAGAFTGTSVNWANATSYTSGLSNVTWAVNLSGGVHVFTAYCMDNVGLIANISSISLRVDLTDPEIASATLTPTSWTAGNATISFSTSDSDSQIMSVCGSVLSDSRSVCSATATGGISMPYSWFWSANLTVILTVTDFAGRTNMTTLYWLLDRNPPVVTTRTGLNSSSPFLLNASDLQVNVSAIDYHVGCSEVRLFLGGNHISTVSCQEANYSFPSANISGLRGWQNYSARAFDLLGNSVSTGAHPVYFDVVDQICDVTVPTGANWSARSSHTVWGNCTHHDLSSLIQVVSIGGGQYTFFSNGSNISFSSGEHNVTIKTVSVGGRVVRHSAVVLVDLVQPYHIAISAPSYSHLILQANATGYDAHAGIASYSWRVTNATWGSAWTAVTSNGTIAIAFNTTRLGPGDYSLEIVARDGVGHSTQRNHSFTVTHRWNQSGLPAVAMAPLTNGYLITRDPWINWSASSYTGGSCAVDVVIANVSTMLDQSCSTGVQLNISSSWFYNASWIDISLNFSDSLGLSSRLTLRVAIDSGEPTVTCSAPTTWVAGTTISLNCLISHAHSGSSIRVSVNNASWFSINGTNGTIAVSAGSGTIAYQGTSPSGAWVSAARYITYYADDSPPEIEIDAPSAVRDTVNVSTDSWDNYSGIYSVHVRLEHPNGTALTTWQAGDWHSFNVSNVGDGQVVVVVVRVVDNVSWTNYSRANVTVISSLASNASLAARTVLGFLAPSSRAVDLVWHAAARSGAGSCTASLTVEGVHIGNYSCDSGGYVTINLPSSVVFGQSTLNASLRARDQLENWNEVAITVRLDWAAPSISCSTPNATRQQSVQGSCSANHAWLSNSTFHYTVDNASWIAIPLSHLGNHTIGLANLTDGNHTIRWRASSPSGIWSSSSSANVFVDRSPPNLTVSWARLAPSWVANDEAGVLVTAIDSGSGIGGIRARVACGSAYTSSWATNSSGVFAFNLTSIAHNSSCVIDVVAWDDLGNSGASSHHLRVLHSLSIVAIPLGLNNGTVGSSALNLSVVVPESIYLSDCRVSISIDGIVVANNASCAGTSTLSLPASAITSGSAYIVISAHSANLNISGAVTLLLDVDALQPILSCTDSTGGSYTNAAWITIDCNTAHPLNNSRAIEVRSGSSGMWQSLTNGSITLHLPEGDITMHSRWISPAGRTAIFSWSMLVDRSGAVVDQVYLNGHPLNGQVTTDGINVSFATSDDGIGVSRIEYSMDGGFSYRSATASAPFALLSFGVEGNVYLHVRAVDLLNQTGSTAVITLIIDTSSPVLAAAWQFSGTWNQSGPPELIASGFDNFSNCALSIAWTGGNLDLGPCLSVGSSYNLSTIQLTHGLNILTLRAVDDLGHVSIVNMSIDSDLGEGLSCSISQVTPKTTDGITNVSVIRLDFSCLAYDFPIGLSYRLNNGSQVSVPAGMNDISFPNGVHVLSLEAISSGGHTHIDSLTIDVDTLSPTINASTNAIDGFVDQTLVIAAQIWDAHVFDVESRLECGTMNSSFPGQNDVSSGTFRLEFDVAGIASGEECTAFLQVTDSGLLISNLSWTILVDHDSLFPQLEVETGPGGAVAANGTLTLRILPLGSGATCVDSWFTLDDDQIIHTGCEGTWQSIPIPYEQMEGDILNLTGFVEDVLGRIGTVDLSVPVDHHAVMVVLRLAEMENTNDVSFEVQLDHRLPVFVSITVDGAVTHEFQTEAGDLSLLVSELADGLHEICIETISAGGWRAQSCSSITIDTAPPAIELWLGSPVSGQPLHGQRADGLSFEFSIRMPDAVTYSVIVDGEVIVSSAEFPSTGEAVHFLAADAPGLLSIKVVGTDRAGNTAVRDAVVQVIGYAGSGLPELECPDITISLNDLIDDSSIRLCGATNHSAFSHHSIGLQVEVISIEPRGVGVTDEVTFLFDGQGGIYFDFSSLNLINAQSLRIRFTVTLDDVPHFSNTMTIVILPDQIGLMLARDLSDCGFVGKVCLYLTDAGSGALYSPAYIHPQLTVTVNGTVINSSFDQWTLMVTIDPSALDEAGTLTLTSVTSTGAIFSATMPLDNSTEPVPVDSGSRGDILSWMIILLVVVAGLALAVKEGVRGRRW